VHDHDEQLEVALEMSGVHPPQEDRTAILAGFTSGRELAAQLYTVPGVRYEEPALIFSATPGRSRR
jgi:hypothetical protein